MFRAEDERQEGAAQAAGGPENGADKSARRQSHWRSCFEAFKDVRTNCDGPSTNLLTYRRSRMSQL